MLKLEVTEKWRVEDKNEAESFIKTQRENGARDGYEVVKAGYVHKEKKSSKEVVDDCELVTITKEYAGIWNI